MIFFLTLFIIFIKFFIKILIGLFVFTDVLIKLIGLCILISLLHYIYTYPIRRRRKLSKLRAWRNRLVTSYVIKTYKDYIWNTFILIIYPLIFIVGILWLRFRNTERAIDLLYYYYEFKQIFALTSISNIILNLLLFICLFLLYIKLLSSLGKYFKVNVVKRHIYLNNGQDWNNNYPLFVCKMSCYLTIYIVLCDFVARVFYILGLNKHRNKDMTIKRFLSRYSFNHTDIERRIFGYLNKIKYHLHQSILIMVIIYDIIFNHFILTHMFIILPYIFLYDIWVRLSKFLDGINAGYDEILYEFLYSGNLHMIRKEDYVIGYMFVETKTLKEAIEYAYGDLYLDEEKESKKSWAEFYKELRLNTQEDIEKFYEEIGEEVPKEFKRPIKTHISLYEIGLIITGIINILCILMLIVIYINLNNFV